MRPLSTSMRGALRVARAFGRGRVQTYMPWANEQRTYDALERRGLIRYRSVDEPGIDYNGYEITEAGLKELVRDYG